jgi:hypothetical protein
VAAVEPQRSRISHLLVGALWPLLEAQMTRGTTWMLLACFVAQSLAAGAQESHRQPSETNLRTSLNRGERIAIELTDHEQLTGLVGARLNHGFELQPTDAGKPRFVKYSDVTAILDPDTGEVVGYPLNSADPADVRWVKPVLIGLATVGVLALLTRGLFPACLFQSCR